MEHIQRISVVLLVGWLSACATLMPDYQQPEVNLTKVEPLQSTNMEQRFLVGLRITNPNDVALDISGLSYSLSLQGHKVVSGVSNNIDSIAAYGDTLVELEASASLMGGFRALMALLGETKALEYELETRLDTGWWPWPITVVESGAIELTK